MGDPGPGLCSITTVLCDRGQVAEPLWVSVLLAKQGTVDQLHSLPGMGGLSVPQHMTPDHAGARERTLCSLHTQPLMGDVLSEFMSSHLHIWAMDL